MDKACGKVGMEAISAELGSSMRHPSKKITVMIVGNHSAGKSSFINWYAGSEVLATVRLTVAPACYELRCNQPTNLTPVCMYV